MYLQLSVLIGQLHEVGEISIHLCIARGNLPLVDLTRAAVQRDPIALLVEPTAHLKLPLAVVYLNASRARYAALTHSASHYGSVRSHTATRREDSLGGMHPPEVFRRGL